MRTQVSMFVHRSPDGAEHYRALDVEDPGDLPLRIYVNDQLVAVVEPRNQSDTRK